MLATLTRDIAIRELNIEHAAVRGMIEALTDEEMTRPDTIEYGLYPDQELSFKDLLAHLITYEAFTIEAVEAWRRGEKHPVIEQMQSSEGGRKIHYAGIEDRRPLTLPQILEQWDTTQANLMAMIRGLTDAEWKMPAPFATRVPTDLGGILEIILVAPPRPPYRHLPVHVPDVQAYIDGLRGK
jgi:hypothetical protein